jgi:hypothetical protein
VKNFPNKECFGISIILNQTNREKIIHQQKIPQAKNHPSGNNSGAQFSQQKFTGE